MVAEFVQVDFLSRYISSHIYVKYEFIEKKK